MTNKTATMLDMDEIARLVTEVHHIPAFVAHTGGNIATIYAGATHTDDEGDDRYDAGAGPGSYGGWGEGPSVGEWTEFSVGPDDNGESGYIDVADVGATTEADVAKIIAAQASKPTHQVLTPAEVDALGLDGQKNSAPAWVLHQRAEGAAWCEAHNTALHAAYAAGSTSAEAGKAATDAMKNWSYTGG
ncbi:hypothetical protein [Tessaracoccus sp.]